MSIAPRSANPLPLSSSPFVLQSDDSDIEVLTAPLPLAVPAYNARVDDSAIFNDSMSRPSCIIPFLSPARIADSQARNVDSSAIEELSGSEHEDGEGSQGLNLTQFAFKNTQPVRNRTTPPSNPPARAKKQTERFADQYTDAQLQKVLKCVCCNLKWTTRKSAAQKLVHLRSCAKKQAFTDETVRIRMTQYLATVVDTAPVIPAASAGTSETYFQEVVRDAAPKKRARRKEVTGTVKAPEDTRASILRRAETLLGQPSSSRNVDSLPATQAFVPSKLAMRSESESDGEDAVPATQAFRPSRFGRQPSRSPSPEEESEPSATQAFAPSTFHRPQPNSVR